MRSRRSSTGGSGSCASRAASPSDTGCSHSFLARPTDPVPCKRDSCLSPGQLNSPLSAECFMQSAQRLQQMASLIDRQLEGKTQPALIDPHEMLIDPHEMCHKTGPE